MHRRATLRGLAALSIGALVIWLGMEWRLSWSLPASEPLPTAEAQPSHDGAPAATPAPSVSATQPPAAGGGAAPAAAPSAPETRPISSIRSDYDSEARAADAPAAEARIREIFAAQEGAEGSLREVRCTKSVCRIDARWSKELNRGYNAALIEVVHAFSREMSFEPGAQPDSVNLPMTIFVRRSAVERVR